MTCSYELSCLLLGDMSKASVVTQRHELCPSSLADFKKDTRGALRAHTRY